MSLDDAYANAPYIPGADAYPDRWSTDAATFRDQIQASGRATLGLSYGTTERQAYDLFSPDVVQEGLAIFVHGGYWMKFHRTFWSHFAQGLLERGWNVAVPSYDLCPDVSIAQITQQIAKAITRIAEQTDGPIRLTGHSAGGHLVARMCIDGVLPQSVMTRIRRVVSISPVSDLRPLTQTTMNEAFRLTEDLAVEESPALMTPLDVPVTVWVGADERPVFLDQARWLSDAWNADLVIDKNRHHFDVIDGLRDPNSTLVTTLLS